MQKTAFTETEKISDTIIQGVASGNKRRFNILFSVNFKSIYLL